MNRIDRRSLLLAAPLLAAAGLVDAVARVRPAIVGITTVRAARVLPAQLAGTGFAVGQGRHVVTNFHVVASGAERTAYFVLCPMAGGVDRRVARAIAADPARDLALLEIEGAPLPPVRLRAAPDPVPEGSEIAITGFPIGTVLGLVPATHRGIVAAVTGNRSALPHSSLLDTATLRGPRFQIYQLDLVAYPGNSGSPLYLADSGEVIGIINSGFIKSTKERVLGDPSGISFAIPSRYIVELLTKAGINR